MTITQNPEPPDRATEPYVQAIADEDYDHGDRSVTRRFLFVAICDECGWSETYSRERDADKARDAHTHERDDDERELAWEPMEGESGVFTVEYEGFQLFAALDSHPDAHDLDRPWWSVERNVWSRDYGPEMHECASGGAPGLHEAKLAAIAWVDEAVRAQDAMERLIDEAMEHSDD
jgi:hypothetical protein